MSYALFAVLLSFFVLVHICLHCKKKQKAPRIILLHAIDPEDNVRIELIHARLCFVNGFPMQLPGNGSMPELRGGSIYLEDTPYSVSLNDKGKWIPTRVVEAQYDACCNDLLRWQKLFGTGNLPVNWREQLATIESSPNSSESRIIKQRERQRAALTFPHKPKLESK